jgi:hypothetical protein
MTALDWTVMASAIAAICIVNWYFFIAPRRTAARRR